MSLDVERLAVAMNTAQVTCEELRLGRDLRVPAARIVAALAAGIDAERLGRALHEVYCHRNAPMHSERLHSAEAIVAAYEADPA